MFVNDQQHCSQSHSSSLCQRKEEPEQYDQNCRDMSKYNMNFLKTLQLHKSRCIPVLTVILFSFNQGYVDGASITYDTAVPKHIWTYAIGVSLGNSCYTCSCLCNSDRTAQVPPYVGRDYYCETGYNAAGHSQTFFPNDPLWDGQQCVGVEAPCCTHPNMPWFTKTLGETTTEDIQLRLCNDHGIGDEETLLQLIDLYVYWHKQFFCSMQWLCITVWIVISLHIPKLCS